ncbi:fungal-specific transcription factor domain-containing protein [Hysterangium stoloniferum]|nr:fungal-specific transcription factor domain-containing protein [Hysterangium stoloniferum]
MEETERLTKKNAEFSERIRLLEEGLASIQAGISDEIHPLLMKPYALNYDDPNSSTKVKGEIDDMNDSLGTLTIEQDGRSLFLGNTAGVESLFRESNRFSERPTIPSPNVLHSLGIFSSLHDSKEAVMKRLEEYLPDISLAQQLVDVYFDHGAWLYNPISKTRFFDEIFHHVYSSDSTLGSLSRVTSHNAAVLFMIFALATFLSHNNITDAEHYHQLARTSMSCDAILVDPTMPSIRAMLLMAFYHLLTDNNGPQHCWALMGLSSHMAQNIGLHRDSWRWKLDEDIAQERRALFWELYWLGINQCLNYGRPPSLSLDYCDCEMPRSEERPENRLGEIKPGFHIRKLQFASECTSQVVRAVLGIKQTPYSTILALDRKVRDHQALKIPPNGATGPCELGAATEGLTLQRFFLKALAEMITDHPEDILHCQFGPSALAAYRSASTYIALMSNLCDLQPELPTRFVVFWNHLMASSIVVGSIATKCPTSVLAQSSIKELDACYTLFERAAGFGESSGRPARALVIVSKIRDRAHQVAARIQAGILPQELPRQGDSDNCEEEHDELSILSGRGRLIAPKSHSPTHSTIVVSSRQPSICATDSPSPQREFDAFNAAHPALLDNLRHATQQPRVTTIRPVGELVNDGQAWQDITDISGINPGNSASQPEDVQFALPPNVGPSAHPVRGNVPAPLMFEQDTGPTSLLWNMMPIKPNPEAEGHGGLGTAMSWESNWQGYLHQFGMVYADAESGF